MESVKDALAPGLQPATPADPAEVAPLRSADEVLDDLLTTVPATRGAVLATVDGFPIAKSSDMPAEPAHAAMLAAAIGLARQLVTMGDGSTLRQLVVDHDGGLLLVWPIGTKRVLAVITDSTVEQRALRSFVQSHVRMLLGSPARSDR